jgi:ubiquinone/menaquinone biosynthesis C-methylase UbiE
VSNLEYVYVIGISVERTLISVERTLIASQSGGSPTSNEEWKAWGKLDPLYGVASIPGHAKNGPNPWTDDNFYELGAIDWDLFRPNWERYGVRRGTCVEIGCGAGRLTAQLARYFDCVHGLDVSGDMIEYARGRVPANVFFHLTGGLEIPLADSSADGIFSAQVLQHLSRKEAAAIYFREMHRVLLPGGTIMLHVPLFVWPRGSFQGIHNLVHTLKCKADRWRTQLGRHAFRLGFTNVPPMQVTSYELTWLYLRLEELSFKQIEIRVLFGGSKMAVQHPFVFATKI